MGVDTLFLVWSKRCDACPIYNSKVFDLHVSSTNREQDIDNKTFGMNCFEKYDCDYEIFYC